MADHKKGADIVRKGQSPAKPETSSNADISRFLSDLARIPPRPGGGAGSGRLIFAMDATASREPTWDRACHLQAEMFEATSDLGGLAVQLVFYRGFRECKASPWLTDTKALQKRMTGVGCLAGHTQIGRVLAHAAKETKKKTVNALIFVGDMCEEDIDALGHRAGELGILGVPAFIFHEGRDPIAARVFRHVAKLTGGAYCPFDSSSAQQLKDLLGAVAVFAAGGRRALADYGKTRRDAVLAITSQLGSE
ncbi:MAG: VWA domain-containing protein [Pseudomonadota bacterium]